MGLNSYFRYKNIDLSIVTRASLGNYMYNNMASSKSYLNRATENGILTNLSSDYYKSQFVKLTDTNLRSDYYIQDASFFKLDNITLGYTINNIIKQINMRLYLSIQNVAAITDYDGIDPEIIGYAASSNRSTSNNYDGIDPENTEINAGIDNNFYPRPVFYMFGININF